MPHSLIRTFAQTFGFPYTETLQELPPLEGNRHLHLGALADFYRHMDGIWHSDDLLANYWLEMETLFLQWVTYPKLPNSWHDWAFGWDRKTKQYLPTQGWREEWAIFGIMFDDSILFADTAAPRRAAAGTEALSLPAGRPFHRNPPCAECSTPTTSFPTAACVP